LARDGGEKPHFSNSGKQHCTDPLMEAPASASHVGSGIGLNVRRSRTIPRESVHVEYFFETQSVTAVPSKIRQQNFTSFDVLPVG